jgi:hypothetical protein
MACMLLASTPDRPNEGRKEATWALRKDWLLGCKSLGSPGTTCDGFHGYGTGSGGQLTTASSGVRAPCSSLSWLSPGAFLVLSPLRSLTPASARNWVAYVDFWATVASALLFMSTCCALPLRLDFGNLLLVQPICLPPCPHSCTRVQICELRLSCYRVF